MGLFVSGGSVSFSSKDDTNKAATFVIGVTQTTPLQDLLNDSNGGFGGGGPISAAIDGQVSVNLPVDFPTQANSLGSLTVTVGDLNQFVSDVLLAPGNLANDISFEVPDLTNAFSDVDLLGNTQVIIAAIDTFLNVLQSVINNALLGQNLPLVGKSLDNVGDFLTGPHSVESFINAIGSVASIGAFQTALFNALGPSGANLLQSGTTGVAATAQDIQIEIEQVGSTTFSTVQSERRSFRAKIQDIQFLIDLGGTYALTAPINFDLGLPGLGFR